MNVFIICVGKIKENYILEGIAEFLKRMKPFANISIIELKESGKDININESIKKESVEILKAMDKINGFNVLLDLRGKEYTSIEMANAIEKIKVSGNSKISFIIGGSNGVSDEVFEKSDLKLSFSKFTFPHQLMRLILIEQVYRWFGIINNNKYHK